MSLLVCALVLIGVGAMWSVPPQIVPVPVAQSSTILYYSSPAAVQTQSGVAIGYVDVSGGVRVSLVSKAGAVRSTLVHQFDGPNDHAAPAVWPGEGGVLVATARHSSDLFLYHFDGAAVRLVCRWEGRYSYPRFDDDGTGLRLYVRTERGTGEGSSGDLSFVTPNHRCGVPRSIFRSDNGDWIYAAPPSRGRVAWSVFNQLSRQHNGLWIDGHPTAYPIEPYDEVLAWSVGGEYLAVTRFSGAFECCNRGEETYDLLDSSRSVIWTGEGRSIYYPGGIVLSASGNEGLFPNKYSIVRRSLPDLERLPSCSLHTPSTYAQYVKGGNGSYVFVHMFGRTDQRDYRTSTVYLCPAGETVAYRALAPRPSEGRSTIQ
jgi:hypothetical protein